MLPSMVRSIQILSVFLLLTLASVSRAQTPVTCGIVGIDGPALVDPGTPLVFKARITGIIHTTKSEFKWTLSAGTITTGEGTDEITVDTAGLDGQEVTVTVELSGALPGCNRSASRTTGVHLPVFVCGMPLDEYGDIKFEDEKARLDNFAIQLSNEPLSIGYILMSAGQTTFENETTERLERARSYLVNVRAIDRNRVVTIDCGFTSDLMIKLYVASLGAMPLGCSSLVQIPFSEVKFTKPRPKASKKRR
jgi:hypothetical protein